MIDANHLAAIAVSALLHWLPEQSGSANALARCAGLCAPDSAGR